MKKLFIAGTGVKFLSHLTIEVKSLIETGSCILYLLNEPAIKNWVMLNSKKSVSLDNLYFSSLLRTESYNNISTEILKYVNEYDDVCFLTYGHPTFFSSIVTQLKRKASLDKLNIQIMPGISALDCLFADLGIDPGEVGMQSYEATEFLLYEQSYSTTSHLILWQIAVIGEVSILHNDRNYYHPKKPLALLVSKLRTQYPDTHEVYLYVASQYPGVPFELTTIKLIDLVNIQVPRLATLYIPPAHDKIIHEEILTKLDLL